MCNNYSGNTLTLYCFYKVKLCKSYCTAPLYSCLFCSLFFSCHICALPIQYFFTLKYLCWSIASADKTRWPSLDMHSCPQSSDYDCSPQAKGQETGLNVFAIVHGFPQSTGVRTEKCPSWPQPAKSATLFPRSLLCCFLSFTVISKSPETLKGKKYFFSEMF